MSLIQLLYCSIILLLNANVLKGRGLTIPNHCFIFLVELNISVCFAALAFHISGTFIICVNRVNYCNCYRISFMSHCSLYCFNKCIGRSNAYKIVTLLSFVKSACRVWWSGDYCTQFFINIYYWRYIWMNYCYYLNISFIYKCIVA